MALRFRRSVKIAPGLRVNFTHRGVSARIGPRGLGYTVNSSGRQHVSAGIPGSGIHMSKQIKPARRQRRPQRDASPQAVEGNSAGSGSILHTLIATVVLLIVALVLAKIII